MRDLFLRVIVVLAVLLGFATQGRGLADLTGGTEITNSVSATFTDAAGNQYSTQSNVVTVIVAKLAALVVSPKETAANAATDGATIDSTATRTFVITNTSNIPDAYKIIVAGATPLTIVSMSFVTSTGSFPATLNSTISPTVQPGDSIELAVVMSTANLAMKESYAVNITAQTTANADNGLQSDTGEQWIIGASSSNIVGPGTNPTGGSGISKTVDHVVVVQSSPGATVTYDVVAQNAGGTQATGVLVTDTVPTGLTADPTSVMINGVSSPATLSGQVLTIPVGSLNAGATVDVSFNAMTPNISSLGTSYVNVASMSADGMPAQQTTPASVLIGSANIVYNGLAGSGAPVSGATVTLLDANGNLVTIGGTSSSASAKRTAQAALTPIDSEGNTSNPVVTSATGAYGFALLASQIAAGGSTFTLDVNAPGYLNRKIQLTLTPTSNNQLYNVTSIALDEQPIAVAGGYTLTKSAERLSDVFGLFGNIPLFDTRTIVVTKTADRSTAQPGDRVRYEIDFANSTQFPIGATQVIDVMSAGLVYAKGTGQLDGVNDEPTISGQTLTWSLASLDPGAQHKITYDAIVYPTVATGTNLTNNVTVNGVIPGTVASAAGTANVTVQVVAGALTQRRPITGRVFVDNAGTGHFKKGDSGIAGVRIFLEDGSFVVTDPDGRFNFPSARPGMHVLHIDETTLPKNVHPYPNQRMNSTRAMQQLVHGIMDDGLIDDVEFALEP